MDQIKDMLKIKLVKNEKTPACKWKNNNHFKDIDSELYNVGLITGKLNDIIVLDVDTKDNGIEEMQKYYDQYGEIPTLKQISPNGGYHLFFKYTSSNEDDQYIINNFLLNSSKYRNAGLDIRSNGGYIVVEPSCLHTKKYQFVNEHEIIEIPHNLIEFLLIGYEPKKQNIEKLNRVGINLNQHHFKYDITDNEINQLLLKLDDTYCNETKKWLIITQVLKGLDKFQIWNDWSSMSELYNKESNLKIWNSINNPIYDINYITYKLGKKPINKYKPYTHLTTVVSDDRLNKRTMNGPYIDLTLAEFMRYNTIVMKSTTGTGKTTTTAKNVYEYLQSNNKRVLSIISKKSLCDQHISSFKKAGVHLNSYLDKDKHLQHDNIVVCINSIMILSKMPDIEFSKYIVYIDEISSFLSDVTHNETLRGKLKVCYQVLMRIIKNCHKLIVSDAKITDNTFNFLRTRPKNIFYLENKFKKYQNVPAVRVRDEELYLDKLIDHVKTNQYFLCASDSCSQVTKFYLECKKHYLMEDVEDKFILITGNNPYPIMDASIQFKEKFVFYSPTIVFGVDFSIEESQDMFVYNKGLTLDPSMIYQQTTRCRNIKTLFYYSELQSKLPKYSNLNECKSIYETLSLTSNEINEVCVSSDENDNETITKNTFFDLFVYNEYVKDIYETNKTSHYQNILKYNGFILSDMGNIKKIEKIRAKELAENVNDLKDSAFNDLVTNGTCENILINDHINLLNLHNASTDILELYKDQITDKFKLEQYLNIIRLLKSETFINSKITQLEHDNYTVTNIASPYHKIKQILFLAKEMNIQLLEINKDFTFYNISDNQYKLICKIFRTEKAKPKDKYNLMKLYTGMLRNIAGNELVISTMGKTRASRKISYEINTNLIHQMIGLNKYTNPSMKHFDITLLNSLGIETIPFEEEVTTEKKKSLLDIDIFDD